MTKIKKSQKYKQTITENLGLVYRPDHLLELWKLACITAAL